MIYATINDIANGPKIRSWRASDTRSQGVVFGGLRVKRRPRLSSLPSGLIGRVGIGPPRCFRDRSFDQLGLECPGALQHDRGKALSCLTRWCFERAFTGPPSSFGFGWRLSVRWWGGSWRCRNIGFGFRGVDFSWSPSTPL